MTHLIISTVSLAMIVFLTLIHIKAVKLWQKENAEEISTYKAKYGKHLTLYPKGHSKLRFINTIILYIALGYFIISICLYIF